MPPNITEGPRVWFEDARTVDAYLRDPSCRIDRQHESGTWGERWTLLATVPGSQEPAALVQYQVPAQADLIRSESEFDAHVADIERRRAYYETEVWA